MAGGMGSPHLQEVLAINLRDSVLEMPLSSLNNGTRFSEENDRDLQLVKDGKSVDEIAVFPVPVGRRVGQRLKELNGSPF